MKLLLIKPLPKTEEANKEFNKKYSVGTLFTKLSDPTKIFAYKLASIKIIEMDNFPINLDETNCFKEIPDD